jgi:hypothetical protein
MHSLPRRQKGFFAIAMAVFAAALITALLLSSFSQLVLERKRAKIADEPATMSALATHAMDVYTRNALDIEGDTPARAAWLADPARFLAGAQIPPALKNRQLGVLISPVRSYLGQGTATDRAQYFAFTRVTLYLANDSLQAPAYLPWFDANGVLHPCGAPDAASCPVKFEFFELPIASWQAERVETAIRQVESLAQLFVTYFNAQTLLDPIHELSSNHFRDPYCGVVGSQVIPVGRLPCIAGFGSLYTPGSQGPALVELLQRAGVTSAGLSEFYYPWGDLQASRIEIANEVGSIAGAPGWTNSTSYPYTLTVRQPLPWPDPSGNVTYVKAVAVQP